MKTPLAFILSLGLLSLASCEPEKKPKPPKPKSETTKRNTSGENITDEEFAEAKTLKKFTDSVQKEIDTYRSTVRGHFNDCRFDELENLASEARDSKEIFNNGSWKIAQFYSALDCLEDQEDTWERHDTIYQAWLDAKPDSVSAHIAYAQYYVNYAWHARGTGYADTVTAEGWRLMKQRLEKAFRLLGEARLLKEKDPFWGSVALTVALGQGWSEQVYADLMKDLHENHPGYWGYDVARAYSLLPRWYGEEGDWEKYAEERSNIPDGLGDELYARIIIGQHGFFGSIFRESKASWPRTKNGLEILRKKYPDSVELLAFSAKISAIAMDRKTAQPLFEELGDRYISSVWREKPERMIHMRTWARTGKW